MTALTDRTGLVLAAAAAVGIGLSIAGAAVDLGVLMHALVAAGLVWLALPLGAVALRLTHEVTGGGWGEETAPAARALMATLPLALVPFALVLALGPHETFAWVAPADEALRRAVADKRFYLDLPFLAVRLAVYAAAWLWLAWRLGAWRPAPARNRALGAGGAVLWVLTATFFAFDWVMSLDPHWYSDVLGMVFMAAVVVPAMAATMLLTWWRVPASAGRMRDFATLMLGALLIWVFVSFVPYLIIWMGNLPHEIGWYADRGAGVWLAVTLAMVVLFFALPFAILAAPGAKASHQALAVAAAAILAGHAVQSAWFVLPSFDDPLPTLAWQLPAALLAVGAPWALVLRARLGAGPEGAQSRSGETS